jgi:ATP-dependent RNA helicase RhlE
MCDAGPRTNHPAGYRRRRERDFGQAHPPVRNHAGDPLNFDTLGLSADLLRTVAGTGYAEPTPVQAEAIPHVLAGRDVMAAAQTGTGKTAAFVLPILERLRPHANTSFSPARHPVRALVLVPTRELAQQVADHVRTLGHGIALRSAVVYGGVPIDPQKKDLWGGVEFLVATPGRLLDLVGQRSVDLSTASILVLDEADRMLDMGFLPDIQKILALLPRERQNLMFSATFSDDIRRLSRTILRDPVTVEVAVRNSAPETVRQLLYPVDRDRKEELLAHLIRRDGMRQVLVFCRTKIGASRLASYLDRAGIDTLAIHSDRTQGERTRALEAFKAGEITVLVATDVAARGLDIENLPHVVNFDVPRVASDYIHRIGRTGRAGETGDAITLVTVDEQREVLDIQALLGHEIPWTVAPGFVPDRNARPAARGRGAAAGRTSAPGARGGRRSATSRAPRRTREGRAA